MWLFHKDKTFSASLALRGSPHAEKKGLLGLVSSGVSRNQLTQKDCSFCGHKSKNMMPKVKEFKYIPMLFMGKCKVDGKEKKVMKKVLSLDRELSIRTQILTYCIGHSWLLGGD